MEKICLARRRTERLHPREKEGFEREAAEDVISIGLTEDQCRLIRPADGFRFSERRPDTVFLELHQNEGGQIVFNFHFKRSEPVRMLKPEHVREMLQIGKGTLAGLVRSGSLKCFKVGKSRRFLLSDIMALISRSGEKDASSCPAEIPEDSGSALQMILKNRKDRMPVCDQQTQAGS